MWGMSSLQMSPLVALVRWWRTVQLGVGAACHPAPCGSRTPVGPGSGPGHFGVARRRWIAHGQHAHQVYMYTALVPHHSVPITHYQDDVDAGEETRDEGLKVQEVDAYWLQRRIARALGPAVDAPRSQALAEQVREGGGASGMWLWVGQGGGWGREAHVLGAQRPRFQLSRQSAGRAGEGGGR